jgi:hypothetical protein
LDKRVDLGQFVPCEIAYLLVGGASVCAGGEERSGVVEREAGALGDVDHAELSDGLFGVAALG